MAESADEYLAEEKKLRIWKKAQVDLSIDVSGSIFRRDVRGNLICFSSYGDRTSILGWEFDHRVALSQGGADEEWNMRPLQWQEDVMKPDVTAVGRLFGFGVPRTVF